MVCGGSVPTTACPAMRFIVASVLLLTPPGVFTTILPVAPSERASDTAVIADPATPAAF